MNENAVREEISGLLNLCDSRKEQALKFLEHLEKIGFYSAPASTVHHNNYCGGLIEHSINVTRVLLIIKHRMLHVEPWPQAKEWASDAIKITLPKISYGLVSDTLPDFPTFGT